ncbi:aspartyl-phosphate phosphatase Spo0E family protein [Evansella tamaricis]|uniref:Aspartyl-phosphate phosphatase Spo0E family protein n=1 Tax=Evansella tamaricis TaxID=2069301 RepID=A0ABS6JGB8_9BACI|nr:aspartyl-phosphate phosphatase Spo0E family protein [Evansella tamaricis]MBU9712578.1 aspartyl-phosphate phosphatase Spo0E family protein [Evansella tamaricis]
MGTCKRNQLDNLGRDIEKLRNWMYEIKDRDGIADPEVIKISQLLDDKLNEQLELSKNG